MQTFSEIGLNEEIVRAISDLGFETPTPIQGKVIPFLLETDRDLIAFAQTGTGKTAAFSLPVINKIDVDADHIQALILCPTRELCIQVCKEIENYTKYMKPLRATAVYGGESIDRQFRSLKKKPQIVVGTPGRTKDMINRKMLKVGDIEWLVMDEADEMLTMGFKDDLDFILGATPRDKQSLLFSATMPREVDAIAQGYMHDPETISAGQRNTTSKNVEHHYYIVQHRNRYPALVRILETTPDMFGVVFCRTRRDTQMLAERLFKDNYRAEAIHGDLKQFQRDKVMEKFRGGSLQLLIATDVAARGIDVNDLTHVINYELPENKEIYIHRSGRTGRAGKTGTCISLLTPMDFGKIRFIERKVGQKFKHKLVPTGEELCKQKLLHLANKVVDVEVHEEALESYLPVLEEKFAEFSKEELIQMFLSLEFNQIIKKYGRAMDLNAEARESRRPYDERGGGRRDRRGGSREGGRGFGIKFSKFTINLGYDQQMTPPLLIGLINDSLDSRRKIKIGKIDIQPTKTYFEVDQDFENAFMNGFKQMRLVVKGKPVNLKLIRSGSGAPSRAPRRKKFTV